jgi:hypothetical protein
VLSDYFQKNITDDDDCVVEAAEATLPAQQKIFSKQSTLQKFFKIQTICTDVDC